MSQEPQIDCIAFASGNKEVPTLEKRLAACTAYRYSPICGDIERAATETPLWKDVNIDGFHWILRGDASFDSYFERQKKKDPRPQKIEWMEFYGPIRELHPLGDKDFIQKPNPQAVLKMVAKIAEIYALSPLSHFVTVPQLPFGLGTERNKINSLLAKASASELVKVGDERVLPAIFTHKSHTDGKTEWRKRCDSIASWAESSKAGAVWVADVSLDEMSAGETTLERMRELVKLHKYLREILPSSVRVFAGPYWGLSLVLWARGLVNNPLVSLNNSGVYYIPGRPISPGKTRMVVRSLHRKCLLSPDFRTWLQECKMKLKDESSPVFKNLGSLLDRWDRLVENSKEATAQNYRKWIEELQKTPKEGRALSLFQTLSAAFVNGSQLPDLPQDEAPGRPAGRVAQQLMLLCLSDS